MRRMLPAAGDEASDSFPQTMEQDYSQLNISAHLGRANKIRTDPKLCDEEKNTTYSELGHFNLDFTTVIKGIVLILIIIVAIFSNLLVIFSVILYPKLRGINNYFLVSLAFADLLVACFAMTFNATQEILGRWIFGSAVCDFWNSIDVHASTVSTLHLCAISFDRFYAICKPFDYDHFMNTYSAMGMIAAAWLFPTFISFVPIFLGWYSTDKHLEDRQVTGDHFCRFIPNVPYAFISSALTFWFPVIIMLVVYYLVFKEAMKQKKNMERMNNIRSLPVTNRKIKNSFESDKTTHELLEQSNSSDEIAGSISGSGSTPSFTGQGGGARPHTISPSELEQLSVTPIKTNTTNFGANASSIGSSNSLGPGGKRISLETAMMDARIKARNSIFVTSGTNIIEALKERKRVNSSWRKEHKAFVTLGVVMGTFLICWLPFFTWYLTSTICGEACQVPGEVVAVLFWIGYFNSTLNPVIYAMTNRDFKLAFIGILKRILCCQCTEESRRNSDNLF